MTKINNKKILYEKLGALKFQKTVFKVEKLKFELINKFFPNMDKWFNKYCEKRVYRLCKKNMSEEEKSNIIFNYNCMKLSLKKELVEEKNRNYHFNNYNANSFYNYLLWNKEVHKNGMIRDLIGILISILGICLFNGFMGTISIILLIYSVLVLAIDFECVNLQNYNMCRFEERRELLSKIEERKTKSDIKNYSNVSDKVYEKLKNNIEIPTSSEVVKSLTTKEQLEELRKLALEIKKQRQTEEEYKVKVKGGKK